MPEITYHQFKLRMPEDLKERLEQAARRSGRSVSAEMLYRIEMSFPSIHQMIIEHRLIEMRDIEATLAGIEQQSSILREELEKHRGPGTAAERQRVLARLNDMKKFAEKLSHQRARFDADISNARDELLLEKILASKKP